MDVMLLVADASPLSRIQAFSLRLHESAPCDSSLFSSAHFTGCSASRSCSEDPEQFIDIQQCLTRKRGGGGGGGDGGVGGMQREYTAPFFCGSSALDARLSWLSILT